MFNNFPYSIRKSNITIIYQPRNILYNIFTKNEFILIRNLGHFLTKKVMYKQYENMVVLYEHNGIDYCC